MQDISPVDDLQLIAKGRFRHRKPKAIAQRKAYRARPEVKKKLQAHEQTRARKMDHLKRRYGITAEQKENMHKQQNGCCAICETLVPLTKIHTDHCHKFNYVPSGV